MKTVGKLLLVILGVFLALASCVAALGGSGDRTADPPTATAPDAAPADDATQAPVPLAGIGDTVRDGKFEFVVTDVQTGVQTIGAEYLTTTAQGSFTIVSITVTNIGDRAQTFAGSSQKLLDAAGREFSADSTAGVYLPGGSESFLTEINPGNQVAGKVVFDLPAGTTGAVIELHDSPFSAGVRVALV